jgi:hypothetical protein
MALPKIKPASSREAGFLRFRTKSGAYGKDAETAANAYFSII